jgi:UDP-2,3-diacylglucosamine pyrophosphatase LpxH
VHISDLHLDDRTEPGYLEKIVRLVNEQEPDLIAFTGDFVTFTPKRFVPALVATLSRLEARDGVFAVLGNHDHLTGPEVISRAIRERGATELRNEVRTMKRAGYPLHVCGGTMFGRGTLVWTTCSPACPGLARPSCWSTSRTLQIRFRRADALICNSRATLMAARYGFL